MYLLSCSYSAGLMESLYFLTTLALTDIYVIHESKYAIVSASDVDINVLLIHPTVYQGLQFGSRAGSGGSVHGATETSGYVENVYLRIPDKYYYCILDLLSYTIHFC